MYIYDVLINSLIAQTMYMAAAATRRQSDAEITHPRVQEPKSRLVVSMVTL